MGRRKLQGYARKNYMRHRTTKQQRMINKGVDTLFKGVGAVGKSAAKASKKAAKTTSYSAKEKEPIVKKEGVKLPLSWSIACWGIGLLAFFWESANNSDSAMGWGIFAGLVAYLILRIIRAVQGTAKGFKEGYSSTGAEQNTENVIPEEQRYSPNPEWAGQMGIVDSRTNAEILAPQFLKQAQESAKILQTTTEPATFFARYDFCLGRLMQLEECKGYGVSVSTTADLKKYQSLAFRDEAVTEFIHRTEEKYKAKIESLKTVKAKQNWAEKFHQAFEPYLSYMTDKQKSVLGEASAALYSLAEVPGKKELTEENNT